MPIARLGRHTMGRAIVLLGTAGCVFSLRGLPSGDTILDVSLLGLLGIFVLAVVLPLQRMSPPGQFSMLAIDLMALCAAGCVLVNGSIAGTDARLPFVSGFVIAVLVGVVGARFAAGLLGALAGTMVLAMGILFTMGQSATPDVHLMAVQLTLVVLAACHTAVIASDVRCDTRARELARQVDSQIKSREAAAAEVVSFTAELADSQDLAGIAQAVLRHLRCHPEFLVRAVVLESEPHEIALWEEPGRMDPDQVERRRLRLQEGLARAGSNFIARRLKCHPTSLTPAKDSPDYRMAVDVPVRVGGRVAGVLLVAASASRPLPPERVSMLVDVARRTSEAVRRMERQRDHEQRRTALLLRQMREGVLLLNGDGQIQVANPAARQVLAACATEDGDPAATPRIGELTLEDLAHTPPGVLRRFQAAVAVANRDQPAQLACTAISVMDQGRRIGTLVTVSDVTDEETARRRIVQAEKMTLVGQTLAGVAHELNNPLAALIGYADLLGGMEVPEDLQKPIQQMKDQALRATRIVRNLLNFARRRNPERVPTPLGEMIHGTVELFAYEARMANVEIRLEIDEDLPPVLGDKHALQQIVVNLFQNALHAMQGWKGDRILCIRATTGPDGVLVSVTDTGPGVPEELRRRIFESFYTTKGPSKGTGLGLALSRSIAQEHGGDLILAPDTGQGACFTVRLPKHDSASLVQPGANGEEEPTAAIPRCMLVVDDEASVRETLVAQLGNLGSLVDSASNATEAERLIAQTRYDAMVVDIRMPGLTGLDLHDRLLKESPAVAQRVIFITGDFVNDELLQQAMDTGRVLLEKPFTMKELSQALAETARRASDSDTAADKTRLSA